MLAGSSRPELSEFSSAGASSRLGAGSGSAMQPQLMAGGDEEPSPDELRRAAEELGTSTTAVEMLAKLDGLKSQIDEARAEEARQARRASSSNSSSPPSKASNPAPEQVPRTRATPTRANRPRGSEGFGID